MSARTLTVIIGRKGSLGVENKNMRELAGAPVAAWTLNFVAQSKMSNACIVSTDCDQFAALAGERGVRVIDRPEHLASSGARVDDAVRDAVARADTADEFTNIAILYANVPVRPADLLDRAIEQLNETGADSVQSYAEVGKHHPLWTCVVHEDGSVDPWQGDRLFGGIFRRQDLPPAHIPDGGVTVVTRAALFSECNGPHDFLGTRRAGIITREGEVIDIDSEVDLLVAQAVLGRRMRERAGA